MPHIPYTVRTLKATALDPQSVGGKTILASEVLGGVVGQSVGVISRPFGFGDAGGVVTSVALIPAGARVIESRVVISTLFDAAHTIDVGDGVTPDAYHPDADLDEGSVGTYKRTQETAALPAARPVVVTVGAGAATQGAGEALVWYATPAV